MPVRVVAVLLGLAGALACLPFAAGYLLPQDPYAVLALASLAGYSPYALGLVVLVAGALRQWVVVAVLATALAGQAFVLGPAYIGGGPGSGTPLTVMTANAYVGSTAAEALVREVRARRVDVLAVQELTPSLVAQLRAAGLEETLPHHVLAAAPGPRGTGLWSRSPVTGVPAWPSTFNAVAGDVTTGRTTVRVHVLHPPPPTQGEDAWQRDHDGFARSAGAASSLPTLLVGDFNASVHHRRLRRLLSGRWRDAAEVAGAGVVRTWGPRAGSPELLDPDHVLVDRDMGVRGFDTVELAGSDHRAVVATVLVPTRP